MRARVRACVRACVRAVACSVRVLWWQDRGCELPEIAFEFAVYGFEIAEQAHLEEPRSDGGVHALHLEHSGGCGSCARLGHSVSFLFPAPDEGRLVEERLLLETLWGAAHLPWAELSSVDGA